VRLNFEKFSKKEQLITVTLNFNLYFVHEMQNLKNFFFCLKKKKKKLKTSCNTHGKSVDAAGDPAGLGHFIWYSFDTFSLTNSI